MTKFFPAKAFFKIITFDDKIAEIDYIKVSRDGKFFIEKHTKDGIKVIRLIEDDK